MQPQRQPAHPAAQPPNSHQPAGKLISTQVTRVLASLCSHPTMMLVIGPWKPTRHAELRTSSTFQGVSEQVNDQVKHDTGS